MTVKRRAPQAPEWPPALDESETPEEKKNRLKAEAEARKVSEMIDKQLEQERTQRLKKNGGKILLLGQAESGKSTVLKNFQLYFAPKAFQKEAELWRPVIHLNLVRSINFVISFVSSSRLPPPREDKARRPSNSSQLNPELRKLCIRLAPLRQVEEKLISLLSGRMVPARKGRSKRDSVDEDDVSVYSLPDSQKEPQKLPQEIAFPSNGGWKVNFTSMMGRGQSPFEANEGDQATRILTTLTNDMVALWKDQSVQMLLKQAEIRLDEQPGFFLDQIKRIAHEAYVPQPDDILKARVTTFGPEEHTIVVESGPDSSKEWTIYDVGGSRSQRAVWAQFFDDVNAVIFMAPMSGFNQVLAEDESINRLTDSLRIWQAICSNKLLADVEFILFLNKLDILETKLSSGIQFSSFVTSYTGKNETKPVAKYLLEVFVSLHQQYSPKKRKIHPHLTCAVDTKATASIIGRIKDTVLVKILTDTKLL
ncbi:guanine nucleotide binding protein, alpha subunit [Crepidotus variabilis]|uniref:Guanine nucleotide binding protein, alpha subunit n=1 Tax=Crepidotus variabilis TaxID=179855 RepID=A0A9P6EJ56_9AGAR|nr:guanine nucleotide binding protein, alpha subunit [Crepidotus variabilis]